MPELKNSKRPEAVVIIRNIKGLHARASAKFVKIQNPNTFYYKYRYQNNPEPMFVLIVVSTHTASRINTIVD